jgi:RimJ/RimL family protein N-acetyltransferase
VVGQAPGETGLNPRGAVVPELHTDRLRLRQWTEDDRGAFARLNADARVMEYFPSRLSAAESHALATVIASHLEQHGWGLWAVEVPGVAPFAGFVGLSRPRFDAHFTPCVEVGWRLAKEFWGRGYATEGALAALQFAFETLGLDEIVSFTTASNCPSRRVMERIGMTYDPRDDFDHPGLPVGHTLRRHVLYRKGRTTT